MKGAVYEERALVMADGDTVATAIDDLAAGRTIELEDGESVTLTEDVAFGHKFALVAHDGPGDGDAGGNDEASAPGDEIRKYGEVIGRATGAIAPGEWVHTHNVVSARGRGDLATQSEEGSA